MENKDHSITQTIIEIIVVFDEINISITQLVD